MRQIAVKYEGECRKCSEVLQVGSTAIYERRVGLFCPWCAPTDAEEIRAYRQDAADRKAERYESWAAKRREQAQQTIERNRAYTDDLAFNTQPGHIPLRERIIRQNDRAYESLRVAQRLQQRAASMRTVRVAGDAEAKRQALRDAVSESIKRWGTCLRIVTSSSNTSSRKHNGRPSRASAADGPNCERFETS